MSLEINEKENVIEITFLGKVLEIPSSSKEYQRLRELVSSEISVIYTGLIQCLEDDVKDFDTLCEKGIPCFFECIEKIPSVGYNILTKYDIKDVDKTFIGDELEENFQKCIDAIEHMFTFYMRDLDDYVHDKYNTRIQIPSFTWQGYGTGISGAVKATLQASALNFGSAMMASIGQALVDRAVIKDILNEKNRLYVKHNLKFKLEEEFNIYSNKLLPVVEHILITKGKLIRPDISSEQFKELRNIAFRLSSEYKEKSNKDKATREKAIDAWLDILKLVPTDVSYYYQIRELCGGDKKALTELKELADYWGVQNRYEQMLIIGLRPHINEIFFMAENSIEEMRAKLEAYRRLKRTYPEIKNSPEINVDEEIKTLQAKIEKKECKTTSSSQSSGSSGCFITSAVCRSSHKPDDCYELTAFRSFRDNWLRKQPDGEDLIKEYYQVAPSIVSVIDAQPDCVSIYRSIWEKYLTPCLKYIESGKFEKCKTLYITMVNNLKKQYI